MSTNAGMTWEEVNAAIRDATNERLSIQDEITAMNERIALHPLKPRIHIVPPEEFATYTKGQRKRIAAIKVQEAEAWEPIRNKLEEERLEILHRFDDAVDERKRLISLREDSPLSRESLGQILDKLVQIENRMDNDFEDGMDGLGGLIDQLTKDEDRLHQRGLQQTIITPTNQEAPSGN